MLRVSQIKSVTFGATSRIGKNGRLGPVVYCNGFITDSSYAKSPWSTETGAQHLGSAKSSYDREKINANSTLPMDVDTTRKDDVSTAKYYFGLGKQFVKFYKSGITNVWRNNKTKGEILKATGARNAAELSQGILDGTYAQQVESRTHNVNGSSAKKGTTQYKAVVPGNGHITRAEYQTVFRTGPDFRKLPFFAVVFAVFFEMTPLIVYVFPRITPSTCVLPFQAKRDIKAANSRSEALRTMRHDDEKTRFDSVYKLADNEIRALADALFYNYFLPVSKLPRKYLEIKIQAHITQVRADNILLSRFGSVWAMDDVEVIRACLQRVISTDGRTQTELRADLLLWMVNFDHEKYDAGFFFVESRTSPRSAEKIMKLHY